MRLWTLHPRYLDPPGLVALWREALLAQAVLLGRTRGYTRHPQLLRFQEQPDPAAAIAGYLAGVHAEALARGYRFDRTRIAAAGPGGPLAATFGQLRYEWAHLLAKLERRSPAWLEGLAAVASPDPHPLFRLVPGGISDWERPGPPGWDRGIALC